MPFFEDLFYELKDKIVGLAKSEAKEFGDAAVDDGTAWLQKSKENLKEWTLALTDGKIDGEFFGWLVASQLKIAEMKLLTQTGIGLIKIEKFKDAVKHIVVDTVLTRVLKV